MVASVLAWEQASARDNRGLKSASNHAASKTRLTKRHWTIFPAMRQPIMALFRLVQTRYYAILLQRLIVSPHPLSNSHFGDNPLKWLYLNDTLPLNERTLWPLGPDP
jgi:hypothetical protein